MAVDPLVAAVAAQLPDITIEQVEQVLTAYRSITTGDAIGTLLIDEDTGQVAHRVSEGGIHLWLVTSPEGGVWRDMQPSLGGWRKIRDGKTDPVDPGE